MELAQERYIELRTRSDREKAVNVLTIAEMVDYSLKQEQHRISSTPHEGITDARCQPIRNQTSHSMDFCIRRTGCGAGKHVHLLHRSYVEKYQSWRQETTDAVDQEGRVLARPTTLNAEIYTIRRMFREMAKYLSSSSRNHQYVPPSLEGHRRLHKEGFIHE